MRFRGAIGLRAEPTLSANLLRFLDRVQQLLVLVIFLPGISDSNKPIFHRDVSLSKSLLGCRSGTAAELSHTDCENRICIITRHLDADLRAT